MSDQSHSIEFVRSKEVPLTGVPREDPTNPGHWHIAAWSLPPILGIAVLLLFSAGSVIVWTLLPPAKQAPLQTKVILAVLATSPLVVAIFLALITHTTMGTRDAFVVTNDSLRIRGKAEPIARTNIKGVRCVTGRIHARSEIKPKTTISFRTQLFLLRADSPEPVPLCMGGRSLAHAGERLALALRVPFEKHTIVMNVSEKWTYL